jgi:hypothetical protein
MARIIGNFKFEHPQWLEFITRSRKEVPTQRFFNQLRWYTGSTNVNFGVGQLAEEFLLRDWIAVMRDRIVELSQEPEWKIIREATYCANGVGSRGVAFRASNYLDSITRRYHYVVSGQGRFTNCADGGQLDYAVGDVILFEQQDYGVDWTNNYQKSTEHIVFCLGHLSSRHIHNWDLFAQAHTKPR